jgi:hypothetical protein
MSKLLILQFVLKLLNLQFVKLLILQFVKLPILGCIFQLLSM